MECWLAGDYEIFVTSISVRPDPDQIYFTYLHSDYSLNGYGNPEMDRLLEEGRRELDEACAGRS